MTPDATEPVVGCTLHETISRYPSPGTSPVAGG